MKVLMTADTVGGVWTYALELCAALPDVAFTVATLGDAPTPAQRAEAARLPNCRLESLRCRLEWMPDCERDLAASGEWLLQLAAQDRPDLVHLNGYAHAALSWNAPVIVVAHSCVVSWWMAVHGVPPPPEWQSYRERVTLGVRRADCVIAPTHAMLRQVAALYGSPRHGYVIYNARADLAGTPGGVRRLPVVLGAGRLWDEAKNLATLDRAADLLDWPVYVAGERRAPHGRESTCHSVVALGTLSPETLRDWMGAAAVFAAPALYEPFGLTPLEAALAGCALVLGDIPSLRELWSGAALFVPPRDERALAGAVNHLLENPSLRDLLAAAARRRALLFTPRRMAAAYRAVYEELVPPSHAEVPLPAVNVA